MKPLITFLLLLFCLTLFNCTPNGKHPNNFTLHGKIVGQDTGKIIIRYHQDSIVVSDTVKIIKGEFVFEGTINEPSWAQIKVDNKLDRTEMYIEPGVMNILLAKDKFEEFKMTGSKTQEESKLINKLEEPVNRILDSLYKISSKNDVTINSSSNKDEKKRLEKKNEEIAANIAKAKNDRCAIWLKFVQSHPKSFISPNYLEILYQSEYLSLDSTKSIFNKLDSKVKESMSGQFTLNYIRIKENTQIGAIAPDFKALDLNNQPIILSQFRGKNVVLIEFWASSCGPCRKGFPYLKRLYQKYHPTGFEIIAIANLDRDKNSWISAIKQESIEHWYNLATIFRNDKPMNKAILNDYPVGPIPLSLLIDMKGKIVGSWEGYSAENEDTMDKQLAELLKNSN
ncbi:MAG: TlpA disulfide reductase family protein [Bacteroidia bacterium]|nr:TlpA disulfide reductase family protein [Bacteroidia bacterium]